MTDRRAKAEQQIPFGNDRQTAKAEKQIPFGNDR
jgi:hypothetical protein